jgi:uncharacterized protein YjiS (DUF1127 family)
MKTVAIKTFRAESVDAGPARPTLASLLLRGLSRVIGGIIREMRIRSDIRHLESLSDNILADIGISRGHISHALRQGRVHPYAARAATTRKDGRASQNRVAEGNVIKLVRPAPLGPTRQGPKERRADVASGSRGNASRRLRDCSVG